PIAIASAPVVAWAEAPIAIACVDVAVAEAPRDAEEEPVAFAETPSAAPDVDADAAVPHANAEVLDATELYPMAIAWAAVADAPAVVASPLPIATAFAPEALAPL